MKKILLTVFTLFCLCFSALAQITNCTGWITRDASWSVLPRDDDNSSGSITLPFNFCWYGTSLTNVYINNNGNISFGTPYGTYTGAGFPNGSFVMLAPFWADVDTRSSNSGRVYYKVFPTYMVVQWDGVGYYDQRTDKLNYFQIVISDGSSTLTPGGNVSYTYKSMQWTTGEASGGANGFGGNPAIVGANRGNNVNFFQLGQFNASGNNYNGPTANSGVGWLSNQTFVFNACATNSNNIAPIISGVARCDTLLVCEGDTLPVNLIAYGPESNQTVAMTTSAPGVSGYYVVSNTTGSPGTLNSYFVGSAGNLGVNTIQVTATDNAAVPASSSLALNIKVIPAAKVTVHPPNRTVCVGGGTTFPVTATGTTVTYQWQVNQGSGFVNLTNTAPYSDVTTSTLSIAATTSQMNGYRYRCVVRNSNGCLTNSNPALLTVNPLPVATASPSPQTICSGTASSITLTSTVSGTTYAWPAPVMSGVSGGAAGSGSSIAQTLTATVTTQGTAIYTITPTANGCVGASIKDTVKVNPLPVATATPSPQTICTGTASGIALSSNVSGTTYSWTAPVMSGVSGGTAGSGTTIAQTLSITGSSQGTAVYTITPSANSCAGVAIKDTVYVNPLLVPAVSITAGSNNICMGTNVTFTAQPTNGGPAPVYQWRKNGVNVGTNSNTYSDNTLTSTDQVSVRMTSNVTCRTVDTVNSAALSITVKPIPVASLSTSSQQICSNQSSAVSPSSTVTGTTYTWTVVQNGVSGASSGSGTSIVQTLTNTGLSTGTAIYTITPVADGCTGTAVKDTVFVKPLPAVTNNPLSQTICTGATATIALQANITGTTFSWTVNATNVTGAANGSGNTISQVLNTSTNTPGTVVYTVVPVVNGCTGPASTYTVTVNPKSTGTQTTTICQGQSYTFNGITYTSSNNTAKDTLQNQYGCDSIVTLNLTVTSAITHTINPVICQGNSYSFGGTNYTTSQTGVVHTFQTIQGCDSIVTLNLTVSPPLTGIQNTTICQGQSYTFNGITYTSSNNTAKDTLQTAQGCDSIVTLNLTVTPALTHTINPVICQGNSYSFGGTNYTTSQTGVVHTFQTAQGCDSIVTMNLTVSPPLTGIQTTTICQGQSYTFNGITYTSSNNTAKDTLQNAQGCDSIVTLHLTVTPAITNTINPVICQGNSYTFAGTVYTSNQTGVVHTFQTAQGCDSIVTMNLTVTPPPTHTINPVICQGNSYNFGGTIYTTSQSGVLHTFQTAQGCDSIVTMNLTVSPPLTGIQTMVICQGQSYTFNGIVYTTSNNTAKDTVQNAQGCDSIVTLHLTVNPITYGTQTTVLCQGQSFTFNGITYTSSNYTAKDTLVNQYGCDSIVSLNLTINPVTSGTQSVVICQGHSYTFNGITYTASNTTARDTLVNQYGCDSILTLNLIVTPAPTTTLNDTICLGDSYTFGPYVYTSSQSGVVHNFPTAQGCDSMVTLNLTVLNIVPQPLLVQESGCDVVRFEGTDYTASTIFNDTLYSAFGCDSIYRRVEITVHETRAYVQKIDTMGCDEVYVNGIRYSADAQVRDTLRNQYGCDSVYRDFNIKVYQFKLELSMSPDDPYEMERIEFKTSSYYGNDYKVLSWSPASAFSDQNAKSQKASFTEPAQVIVRARSREGCEDEFRVDINPREYSKDVAVPNAFSPNGDGLNDMFRPILKLERAYNTIEFNIYNRYGQLVHATANLNNGWDGMHNGRPADNGVYSYKLVIYFLDGTNKVFSGEVNLVR